MPAIAFFSGAVRVGIKTALPPAPTAVAVWAATILISTSTCVALAVRVAATAGIDLVYLPPPAYPAKFLIPGTVFLLAFQVAPILYTINVAFDRYSTGHVSSKHDAIVAI